MVHFPGQLAFGYWQLLAEPVHWVRASCMENKERGILPSLHASKAAHARCLTGNGCVPSPLGQRARDASRKRVPESGACILAGIFVRNAASMGVMRLQSMQAGPADRLAPGPTCVTRPLPLPACLPSGLDIEHGLPAMLLVLAAPVLL